MIETARSVSGNGSYRWFRPETPIIDGETRFHSYNHALEAVQRNGRDPPYDSTGTLYKGS